MRATADRALLWMAYSTAIGSVTLTPLLGFVVGDRHPSASATALQLLLAVLLQIAALAVRAAKIRRKRRALAAEIYRRAAARAAGYNPDDRFAATREQAHAAGLPWLETDGTVSWPVPTSKVNHHA